MSSTTDYFECPKCGGQAYREQDNTTCEITIRCKCGWTKKTVKQKEVQCYQKITLGSVVQEYMLNKEGKYICIEQYFESVNELCRERDGQAVNVDTAKEVSQGFDMVQPVLVQDFDEWFEENKNSTLLQERFLSCLQDDPDIDLCFRDWAKTYYETSCE